MIRPDEDSILTMFYQKGFEYSPNFHFPQSLPQMHKLKLLSLITSSSTFFSVLWQGTSIYQS